MELYKLSFPNGKNYIGITSKTAIERFKEHCNTKSQSKVVHKAIRKYGKDNVIQSVIATTDNWELLCLAEQEAIEKFNTKAPYGYNLTDGGEGCLGYVFSDETRLKLKNRIVTEETRAKISVAHKGKIISEETRAKIRGHIVTEATRAKLKGRIVSEETRSQISNRIISEETRKKMSVAAKNRMTIERIEKFIEANKNRVLSEETRKKLAEASRIRVCTEETRMKLRNRVFTAEHRLNLSNAGKGKERTDEHKANLSAALKGKERAKGRIVSDETKAKMSLAVATDWAKRLNRPYSPRIISIKESS